ncbi:MAG: TIGR01777 family protein [Candidatus Omnitrophica bacterium]|nr:TIGR01777 family protein [Candidatus Omnitrophota bacterium]
MKIVVTGATGFIGRSLTEALTKRGNEIIILSRRTISASDNSKIRYVRWNPEDSSSIVSEIDGIDAVINLAGEPIVGKRWSQKQKGKILSSRVNATQIIANSIRKAVNKPKVLINASAVGFYGSRQNELLAEDARSGDGFLAETCKAWEAHAIRVKDFDVRVVWLRTGIVLDKSGGALKMMLPPFKMFLGGWLGNGNQWMSWIAREDLIRLILFCLDHPAAKGPINAVAPQPVTNKAFSFVLAQVLKRPCLMPVPAFALKILLGEMSEMLLTGQRVIPQKAGELGFSFHYPEIRHALETILR